MDLRKNYTQWLLITLIIVLGGLWLKGSSDLNDITKAIEYGYQKKVEDMSKDSLNGQHQAQVDSLQVEIDTLKASLEKLK